MVVDVSITNTSGESQDFNVYDFSLWDAEDVQYNPGLVPVDQDLGFGSLASDETVRGNVGFEVPADADLTRLVYNPGGEGRIEVPLP